MTDLTVDRHEPFSAPPMPDYGDVFAMDTPNWLRRAMSLYEAHSIPNDDRELQGQYTENRRFLRRLEQDRQNGLFSTMDLRTMEEAFAKACAAPEGDPILALEQFYLEHFYARQPKRRPAPRAVEAMAI